MIAALGAPPPPATARSRRSGPASAAVVALLVVPPLGVVAVVARVVSERDLTGAGGLGAISRSEVVALALALVTVLAWLPVALAAVAELRGGDRAPRRPALVPPGLHRVVAAAVEVSHLGAGSLSDWTATRVGTRLGDLEPASPTPVLFEDDAEPGAAPGAADQGPQPVALVKTSPVPKPPGTAHVVARGQTWWGLAQHYWGDGRRFVELKEHNFGRLQPDDAVVERDSVLRPGWTIEVPGPTPGERP